MSSLDDPTRVKLLKQLARTEGTKPQAALEHEAGKIVSVLQSDTDFDTLSEQLTLLDVFAFRVPDIALSACRDFLIRLKNLELTHRDDGSWVPEYETNARLISETLNVLSRIRYFKVIEVLQIFLSEAMSRDDDVRKAASEALRALAEYDIGVVFGSGKGGLGISPQREIIAYLEALSSVALQSNFDTAVKLAGYLLSPNVSGTSWDYRSVQWQSGALPATDGVIDLRRRVLKLLELLFGQTADVTQKLSVIGTMMEATRMPNRGKFGNEVKEMVSDDTVHVLNFLAENLLAQEFPIIQKVEHDAYWRYYHAPTKAVEAAALRIKSLVESSPEYAIYRDLIGFEGVFHSWEGSRANRTELSKIDRYRSERAIEYANNIDDESWPKWRSRIVEFSRTKSDDLATFPKFYEFLDAFARRRPDLALLLLQQNLHDIRDFVIPLMRGIWATQKREVLRTVILGWIDRDQLLTAIAKMFIKNEDVDEDILQLVLAKQVAAADIYGLVQFVSVAMSNYKLRPNLVRTVMLPAIDALSVRNDASWVRELWFRPELGDVVKSLAKGERELFFGFLLNAPTIDFHEEEILVPFAEEDPERVLGFFGQRIDREVEGAGGKEYRAVPFSFHQLHKTLEKFPEIAIGVTRSWFEPGDYLFQFRGAKILSNIFPDFPGSLATRLSEMATRGSIEDAEFVVAVLRSYDGEASLNEVCRAVIAAVPDDHDLLSEVRAVIYTTGTTVGEYGLADAYDTKASKLSEWLADPSAKVRAFAEKTIGDLRKASAEERRRANEELELRKHKFGVREDEPAPDE